MRNIKTQQPRQLTDTNSFLLKRDDVPVTFAENYISREGCYGTTEVQGLEDFSKSENSNNLHGYVD